MMIDFFGPCIRSIPTSDKSVIYLTFDDGPDPEVTPAVLDLLEKHQAKATFFMVADRARRCSTIVSEVVAAGHAIGNHSLDHDTRYFFYSYSKISDWIRRSEEAFGDLLGRQTVGFRSPAGVQTPQLHRALRTLGMPLIHWETRFFDSTFRWKKSSALASLNQARPGQVVLLHDLQKPKHASQFLDTLDAYLNKGREIGRSFKEITSEDISRCKK